METPAKTVSLSCWPMMAASPAMLGRTRHSWYPCRPHALPGCCQARGNASSRSRSGTVHGVSLGDPFFHAWAGQDVFC